MKTFLMVLCALISLSVLAGDDYKPGPDSKPQEGVPKGEVLNFSFENSRIFPGTTREYWIYIPAQYDPATPACLHVNQDGIQFSAPVVFDNLIHKKEMPVTIGVFIMHGRVKSKSDAALDRFNRCIEYDAIDDRYVRFLLEELLPDAETKKTSDGRPIRFSKDGNDRAIAGSSSGAICAFTAAWHRPDSFTRVFSTIGTYVHHRGGNVYPALVRKTETKPLRVYLQDGSNDGNGHGGNWFLANQEMLSAFEFAGYEVNHAWGDGGHNAKHATAIFPDALRWLWKDWPTRVKRGESQRQPAARIVTLEGWTQFADGFGDFGGAAANGAGEVFFSDSTRGIVYRIDSGGRVEPFARDADGARGLSFAPDGRLFVAQPDKKRIVAYTADGKRSNAASGFAADGLCIAHNGDLYATDAERRCVWLVRGGEKRVVDANDVDEVLAQPTGVAFTPDQSLLIVSDKRGLYGWSYHIAKDGALLYKQPYHYLHVPDGATDTGAGAMAYDADGRIYVATRMGIQFCDQAGRLNGILSKPAANEIQAIVFGGAAFDQLYAFSGGRIYKRPVKVKGVRSCDPPFKTKPPPL